MKSTVSLLTRINRWIKGIYERRLWRRHMYALGYADGSSGFLEHSDGIYEDNQFYNEGYFDGVRDWNKAHHDPIIIKNKKEEEIVIEDY